MLKHQGEPTLRSLAEMCTKLAEKLEQEATIERERARRYLEAADARAAEKWTKREEPIRARYAKSRLILKHSKVARPSGQWRDNDYDVICKGEVVGRVFLSPGAPADKPWMWTLAYAYTEDRTLTHGYEATREAAMAALAKSWRRQ